MQQQQQQQQLASAVKSVLDEQGDLSDEYYAIVEHIFHRFGPAAERDDGGPGGDEDGEGWAREHFNAMLAASGEEPAAADVWDHMGHLFVDDWEPGGGRLPLAAYTAMSIVSAEEDPDRECAQMHRLGYPAHRAAHPPAPPPDPDAGPGQDA